ncbi:hypothetical protein K7432_003390 [Basidiobolus ranarum]|uniref:Uncharacterized protein n=1 Tax=Basidiobolus ranarum TaxID=34480 RepID=A0ABR2X032_9FUNG
MMRSLSVLLSSALLVTFVPQTTHGSVLKQSPFRIETFTPATVPVDLYVMSKSSDAVQCEEIFGGILDQIGSIVNLNIYYIGKEENGSHVCKHGEQECRGNKMQLCAKALYRWHQTPSAWFRLIQCQNQDYHAIGTDASLEYCSLKKNMSFKKLRDCTDGPYGARLLSQSFTEAQEKGISTSCTMVINQQVRCVHDSTWMNCDGGHEVADFVRDICAVYKSISSATLPKGCPPSSEL